MIRNTDPTDFDSIVRLCRNIYPDSPPYEIDQLYSQIACFGRGCFVVRSAPDGLLGMSAALIVNSSEYHPAACWDVITNRGWMTNHRETGDTLYGVEFMVAPDAQGKGVARLMHQARVSLLEEMGVSRIRAGIRLAGFARSGFGSPEEYVHAILDETVFDHAVKVHLHMGWTPLVVARNYLRHDPASRGCALVMDWVPGTRV